jgi:phosphatidylserine decarboxylase
MMKNTNMLRRIANSEDLNFLLTNRIPRAAATRFMGWFSKLEHPLLCRASIAAWRLFTDLDLTEAERQEFRSLHDCFVRALKPGARPVDADPRVLTSPCDGIVGAYGTVRDGQVFQAKGFPYTVNDLFSQRLSDTPWRDGEFLTLRITSAMYHRFHAPYAGRLRRVHYIAGDTWNVNPIALRRVERLFCKNERALLELEIGAEGWRVALVPVAAILVASIRLHGLDAVLEAGYGGPQRIDCDLTFAKGDELGWFQHGSTIIVFAPRGFRPHARIVEGLRVKMGEPLMLLPANGAGMGPGLRNR